MCVCVCALIRVQALVKALQVSGDAAKDAEGVKELQVVQHVYDAWGAFIFPLTHAYTPTHQSHLAAGPCMYL